MKILSDKEVEYISISSDSIDNPKPMVTNTGLSKALIDELSADISDDGIICLLKLQLENDKWYKITSNPSEYVGINERGVPIYKTVWNGEDWLYMPFEFIMTSMKSSGEIVGSGLRVVNSSPELSLLLENPKEAIPVQIYIISKKEKELMQSYGKLYLTTITNTISEIKGEIKPADVLSEQLPSLRYYPTNFRRL